MKLENTTVLSAIVWVAGILAEIMFQDIFSRSVAGVALSIILALVLLVLTYYIVDGFSAIFSISQRAMLDEQRDLIDYQKKSQQEHQKKMLLRLDARLEEQLELSKKIISYVSGQKPAEELFQNVDSDDSAAPVMDKEVLEQMVSSINSNTVQVAKLLAKYQRKCNDDIQKILEELEELKD